MNISGWKSHVMSIRTKISARFFSLYGSKSLMARVANSYPKTLDSYQVDLIKWRDLNQVVSIQRAAYQGYVGWKRADFKAEIGQNPYAFYLVLRDRGKLIGMVSGRIRFKESHISHLFLLPEYQGRGIGQALLEKWVEMSQIFGTEMISLELRASNQGALRFYQARGFTVVGEEKAYYPDNQETAILMEKR